MAETYSQTLGLRDAAAGRNRVFSLAEAAAAAAAGPEDLEQLRQDFIRDSRFVRIAAAERGAEGFLPERELFLWWAAFNQGLAGAKQCRAEEGPLLAGLNALRASGAWPAPPPEFMDYGRQRGLVADTGTPGVYCFPLAHIMAQSPPFHDTFGAILADFADRERRETAMQAGAAYGVDAVLSQLAARDYRIITGREGLPPYEGVMTLRGLGEELGCSRERIRQLESRIWVGWRNPAGNGAALVAVWVAELLRRGGALLVDANAADTPYLRFLARIMGVPLADTPLPGRLLLGAAAVARPAPAQFSDRAIRGDLPGVGNLLAAEQLPFLAWGELEQLATTMAQQYMQRLTIAEKSSLALRRIGRPAHISEITRVYMEMFDEGPVKERNVQQPLASRCPEVVWAGAKSFALKEWGYDLPGATITDTVAMIVGDKYAATGRPVPVEDIIAELRRYVPEGANMSTVFFTARRCPGLRFFGGRGFAPRRRDGEVSGPEGDGE